jgi:hypothetical protein
MEMGRYGWGVEERVGISGLDPVDGRAGDEMVRQEFWK